MFHVRIDVAHWIGTLHRIKQQKRKTYSTVTRIINFSREILEIALFW